MALFTPPSLTSLASRVALAIVPLLAACGTDVPLTAAPVDSVDSHPTLAAPAIAAPRALGPGLRMHTEAVTGVRFPVPKAGITVEERHFDPTLPTYKFRHAIKIKTEEGLRVLIEVWDNPEKVPLDAWFTENMSFLVRDATQVSERPMTSARLPGVLLQEPASEQAASQAIGVFAFHEQVFRVTGIAVDEDASVKEMFDRVLDQIELGVKR